jgi:hypothetical protein
VTWTREQKNAWAKHYRETHRELLRLKARLYSESRREILAFKAREYGRLHKEERKAYRLKNRERANILRRASYHRLPIHRRADSLAEDHVPLGKVCGSCGSVENLERHHPDYTKPFEVLTLCRPCHKKLHSKYDQLLVVVSK